MTTKNKDFTEESNGGYLPVGHRILVEVESREEVSSGGIVIATDDTKERDQFANNKGIVVAIGPTAFVDFGGEPWCEVGDEIIYSKYAGHMDEPKKGQKYYRYVNDEDVIARRVI